MKKIAIIAIITLGFLSSNTYAQKFGYINLGNMVVQMPETANADKELQTYQEGLIKKGEDMAKTFQASYEAFAKEYQLGNMTPKAAAEAEQKLTKDQEAIAKYEQEVIQKVQMKRQELMSPILGKLETAIKAVGAEGGYTFIFDASLSNTILYAKDGDDVEAMVKAKLGL